MKFLNIGLSIQKNPNEIKKLFENLFPEVKVALLDEINEKNDEQRPEIVIEVSENRSEFPVLIELIDFPGSCDEDLTIKTGIGLAYLLSNTLSCKTICDGTGFGTDDSPYWSIIWDNRKSYLADDCNTKYADGKGGEVKIVKEIKLPEISFDKQGKISFKTGQ